MEFWPILGTHFDRRPHRRVLRVQNSTKPPKKHYWIAAILAIGAWQWYLGKTYILISCEVQPCRRHRPTLITVWPRDQERRHDNGGVEGSSEDTAGAVAGICRVCYHASHDVVSGFWPILTEKRLNGYLRPWPKKSEDVSRHNIPLARLATQALDVIA